MGNKHIPPGTEAAALRALTAEARRAAAELWLAITAAKELEPGLVGKFEQIHAAEIATLSNFFTAEANRHATELNADIDRAREMICQTIMAGQAVFDRETSTVTIKWAGGKFDDQQKPTYTITTTKESSK